ncbi:MAG: hypothetical protein Kow0056_10660 [Coriobacteriia bacterium]
MAARMNCWEYKECGREPGGRNVEQFGECPAATESALDGANGGTNAGRACWVVAGTLCNGEPQGTFAQKAADCRNCDFYHQVQEEEGSGFVFTASLLMRLRNGVSSE